jgi:hypothetical protein
LTIESLGFSQVTVAVVLKGGGEVEVEAHRGPL